MGPLYLAHYTGALEAVCCSRTIDRSHLYLSLRFFSVVVGRALQNQAGFVHFSDYVNIVIGFHRLIIYTEKGRVIINVKGCYFDEFKSLWGNYFRNVRFLVQRVYTESNLWDISGKQCSTHKEFVIGMGKKEFTLPGSMLAEPHTLRPG